MHSPAADMNGAGGASRHADRGPGIGIENVTSNWQSGDDTAKADGS